MRITPLFALVLIAALALIGTAAGGNATFQNGNDGYIAKPAGTSYVSPVVHSAGYDCYVVKADQYSQPMSSPSQASNYYAFTIPNSIAAGSSSDQMLVYMFKSDGSTTGYSGGGYIYYSATGVTAPYTVRIHAVREDNNVAVYVGDTKVFQSSNGKHTQQPYYWAVQAGTTGIYTKYADDIAVGQTSNNMVGIMPSDWYIAKDLVEPSMSGMYTAAGVNKYNTLMHASYAVDGDPVGATISIDGDHQVQSLNEYVTGLTVKDLSGAYVPVKQKSGLITFNLTQFMATKSFGRHTVQLHTSDGQTIEEEFWYKASASTETTIGWDRAIYAPQDNIEITTTISNDHWLPGVYGYKACILDSTTGEYMENWSVTSQTQIHSTTASSDLFPVSGEYLTVLYAIDSTGTEALMDLDSCQVYNNKIIYSGTVYNAQQGTVLDGTSVTVIQSGTTYTDTTGSDGTFEITGLEKDVTTSITFAKTGYITFASNSSFGEYKRYEVAVALSPANPSHSGTTVFGAVRCYPIGSLVASPAVKILKDGALINSTTATVGGFYIFDGLDPTTTYTIEADKTGYVHYSNAVVTGSAGSLTQMDPWLLPQYHLNILLKDAVTQATITKQMAVTIGSQSVQTTNGSVSFDAVDMGNCSIAVIGDGYDPYQTSITMAGDRSETLYITPSAIPIVTTIGLTPTPTPAIVGLTGKVYDGMTGAPITGATVNVTAAQGAIVRYDTSDGSGAYDIVNIQNNVLTTINASATGYTHQAFSFTPVGSAAYVLDLYMYRTDESTNPTHTPTAGLAGAGGSVLGGPYHELVESPTVTASNATWSGPATVDSNHVWYFTDLDPNSAYNFTASASGFITRSVPATTGAENSFTIVPIILDALYDVTIEIHDVDSKALVLQPVQVTCSNGIVQNTTTGSTTFTNLEYATYVFSAASEGYQQGGISALAYATHTEYLYLSKIPTGGGNNIEYSIPPKHVELVARNLFGVPLSGVSVTVQGQNTTLPDRGLLSAIFGWTEDYSDVNLANATMTGMTGTDGAVSFLMTDSVNYQVHFTDSTRGIDQTYELMPHDTQYIYLLGASVIAPGVGMPNLTLWADGADGASPILRGSYSDPAGTTSALWFIVEKQNGTVRTEVSNQSFGAVQSAAASFAVNHTTGDMYSWGWKAETEVRGPVEQWSGITLHSRLIDFGIESGWYFWISACFLFIFAGLFSGMTSRFGFVLLPLFALLLWYIGWLETSIATLGLAMVAGLLMYISKVQVG